MTTNAFPNEDPAWTAAYLAALAGYATDGRIGSGASDKASISADATVELLAGREKLRAAGREARHEEDTAKVLAQRTYADVDGKVVTVVGIRNNSVKFDNGTYAPVSDVLSGEVGLNPTPEPGKAPESPTLPDVPDALFSLLDVLCYVVRGGSLEGIRADREDVEAEIRRLLAGHGFHPSHRVDVPPTGDPSPVTCRDCGALEGCSDALLACPKS